MKFAVMAVKLSAADKRTLALQYFLTDQFSQKEIAERVGTNETQISRWAKKERWDDLKKSLLTSKRETLAFLYQVLAAIKTEMNTKQDFSDTKKADAVVKYTAAIKNLETETNIGQLMEAGSLFHTFMAVIDPQLALTFLNHYDAFIKERLNKRF